MIGLLTGFVGLVRTTDAVITTEFIAANGLNFTCSVYESPAGIVHDEGPDIQVGRAASQTKKNIIMLHGFPMSKEWWTPLIEHWDSTVQTKDIEMGFTVQAVACDLRGYSPGASPDDMSAYDYSIFADDVWAIAESLGMGTFHLLGHDHGAGLAWYMAGNDDGPAGPRIESLTTFSVPHSDLLSSALCGDNVDDDQIIALNYFNQFALPDSALINNASLTAVFNNFSLGADDPTQFQKMLWWYIGSIGKHLAQPRVVSDAEVAEFTTRFGPQMSFFIEAIRLAVPMEERPCQGPADGMVGPVGIPTLFVCGANDFTLLCNNPYATNIPKGLLPVYEHSSFECGHDFFLEGNCNSIEESVAVMEKVTSFLFPELEAIEDQDTSTDPEAGEADPALHGTANDLVSGALAPVSVPGLHYAFLLFAAICLVVVP